MAPIPEIPLYSWVYCRNWEGFVHQETIDRALNAVFAFIEGEATLLEVDINERSLTHKMGEYLQRAFPEWNVDCEYNRLGEGRKVLPDPVDIDSADADGITVYPDIIVHKRRERDNLLVIEVKKSTNRRKGDEFKLKGLTRGGGEYGYIVGMHLVIDCPAKKLSGITIYRDGEEAADLTLTARAAIGL
jgi:hypothetical protein